MVNEVTDRSGPWRERVAVAVVAGLSIALLDLAFAAVDQGVFVGSLAALCAPQAGLLLAGAVATLLVVLAIEAILGRFAAGDRTSLRVAAGFLTGVPLAIRIVGWERPRFLRGTLETGSWWLGLGGLAFLLVFFALRGLSDRSRRGAVRVLAGLPAVLALVFLTQWLADSALGLSGGIPSALAVLACTAVSVLALRRFCLKGGGAAVSAILAAVLLAGAGAGLAAGPLGSLADAPPSEGRHTVPRVILVTIDALRADALACLGGEVDTPNLDAFAADGVLFSRAHSPAPWTLPSFTSMMTGRDPRVHGATRVGHAPPAGLTTLAEAMGDGGYATAAFGYNFFLTDRGSSGLMPRGFDRYEFSPVEHRPFTFSLRRLLRKLPTAFGNYATTDELAERAVSWLDANRGNDFFLWLHFYDPHIPYEPPAEFFPDGEPDPWVRDEFGTIMHLKGIRLGRDTPGPKTAEWIRKLYLGEVRYVDDRFGRVMDHLKSLGIYDDALIVVTSDHGDEFLEHGGIDHGHSLYQELLAVPLMVKLPGSAVKKRVDRRVSIVHLAPTILELAGVGPLPKTMEGPTLVPHLFGDAPDERIFATGLMIYADRESVLFEGGLKYTRWLDWEREELYDLEKDPGETKNLADYRPEAVEAGRAHLDARRKAARRLFLELDLSRAGSRDLTEDEAKRLESLGYMK